MFAALAVLVAVATPAWQSRGEAVERQYKAFVANLEVDRLALRARIESRAPELATRLSPAPAAAVPYGYQLLPKLTPNSPPAQQPRAVSAAFGWRGTLGLLEERKRELKQLHERLAHFAEQSGKVELNQLIDLYLAIQRGQGVVDGQIKYNWFWQKDIVDHRPWYDGRTVLHDQVLERQRLLDQLALHEDAALRGRERALAETIHAAAYGDLNVPSFATVTTPQPGLQIVHLELETDISDAAFLERVKQAVESRWKVTSGDQEYRLELSIHPIKLANPPATGAHLDLDQHLKAFPAGPAILTTGALFTNAVSCCAVALGPGQVDENTLAHEFGHLFQFRDGYFRGYRDRGDDGLEVLEIFPDMGDIMCSPGNGRVLASHFEALIKAIAKRTETPQR